MTDKRDNPLEVVWAWVKALGWLVAGAGAWVWEKVVTPRPPSRLPK